VTCNQTSLLYSWAITEGKLKRFMKTQIHLGMEFVDTVELRKLIKFIGSWYYKHVVDIRL
jgi:hypothetical protein